MSRYYDDNILHTGMMNEDEILHYGVKGMKWRKRLKSRLAKSALKDDRSARSYGAYAKMFGHYVDNEKKRKNAIINGRTTHREKGFSPFSGTGISYHNRITSGSVKDAEMAADFWKKQQKKDSKKAKAHRIKSKIKYKLANML